MGLVEQAPGGWARIAIGAHVFLAGVALVAALTILLITAFPSQELFAALVGIWVIPVWAVAILVAFVGTIGAWRNRAIVAAGLTLLVSVTGACFVFALPDMTSTWKKLVLTCVAISATASAALVIRSMFPTRRFALPTYAVIVFTALFALAEPFDIGARKQPLSGTYVARTLRGGTDHLYERESNRGLRYFGSTNTGVMGRSGSYAISSDGRTIVYAHDPGLSLGLKRKAKGVYRRRDGSEFMVLAEADFQPHHQPPESTPARMMVVDRRDITIHLDTGGWEPWVLDADGGDYHLLLTGATPLHLAAWNAEAGRIDELLASRAPIDAQTYWGLTPLELAILRGHDDVARRLLDAGADPRAGAGPAVFIATELARVEVIESMVFHGESLRPPASGGVELIEVAALKQSWEFGTKPFNIHLARPTPAQAKRLHAVFRAAGVELEP